MTLDQPPRLAIGSHKAGNGKGCAMAEAAAFRDLHGELDASLARVEYLRSGRFFRERVAWHEARS